MKKPPTSPTLGCCISRPRYGFQRSWSIRRSIPDGAAASPPRLAAPRSGAYRVPMLARPAVQCRRHCGVYNTSAGGPDDPIGSFGCRRHKRHVRNLPPVFPTRETPTRQNRLAVQPTSCPPNRQYNPSRVNLIANDGVAKTKLDTAGKMCTFVHSDAKFVVARSLTT